MDFDLETYMPDWNGDWDAAGPKPHIPDPQPDPWPEAGLVDEFALFIAASEVRKDAEDAHLDDFAAVFESALKDLEAEDRLGNHEIQRLMQMLNQHDTLDANVREKTDDTENAIIAKI